MPSSLSLLLLFRNETLVRLPPESSADLIDPSGARLAGAGLILIHLANAMTGFLRASIHIVRRILWAIALLILCLTTTWAAAALYFDLPADIAPKVLVIKKFRLSLLVLLCLLLAGH
jgi:hypothetical protein